jgi:Protein of unknown function (DUF3617)
MFRVTRFVALAAMAALLVPAAFAGPQKPGKWETTVQVEMAGMAMKIPPVTTTVCVTEEDLKDPSKSVPSPGGKGQNADCKVSDYKVEGNKVSWSMKCEGKQPVTATGEMTYSGDSYQGSMKMNTQGHDMSMTMTGKRLGDCTK